MKIWHQYDFFHLLDLVLIYNVCLSSFFTAHGTVLHP